MSNEVLAVIRQDDQTKFIPKTIKVGTHQTTSCSNMSR